MWDKKNLGIWNPVVYILYVLMKKVMFFQRGIWNLLIYIHYVPKEKVMFFQYGIKNFFSINTLT